MSNTPISTGKSNKLKQVDPTGCAGMSGGSVLLLLGIVLAWLFYGTLAAKWIDARSWPATQSTIVTSEIAQQRGEDGLKYAPRFTYRYSVNGADFLGDQYLPIEVFTSSKIRAQRAIATYPVGSKQTSFYNPDNPADAVLNRDVNFWILLLSVLPLLLIGGGLLIFVGSWRHRTKKISEQHRGVRLREQPAHTKSESGIDQRLAPLSFSLADKLNNLAADIHPDDVSDLQWDQPMKLKSQTSKWGTLRATLFLALFWNGLTVGGVFAFLNDPPGGIATIGIGLFLIPFVAIGVVLLGALVHSALKMFNPKVEIALSTGAVPLGGSVDLAWEVTGRIASIGKLTIQIRGQESAEFRQGTTTHTDTQAFAVLPITVATTADEILFGSAVVEIPAGTMHSADFGHNKIIWEIDVKGEIPWWPDIDESFPFRVKP